MKKILSFLGNKHAEVFKIFVFVIAVAAIVAIFPKQGKFKYDIQNLEGKPWNYEDLVAPFDFTILNIDNGPIWVSYVRYTFSNIQISRIPCSMLWDRTLKSFHILFLLLCL